MYHVSITYLYTMNIALEYFVELWRLSAEMSPYLLLGLLIAGVLHVYVKSETTKKYLGTKTLKSVVYAALIGVPLPLCSCGVIPTGIGFRREGASKGATVSFLISTPQTGVDSILVTYSMLGWPFALIRPVVAFLTGLAGGVAANFDDTKETNDELGSEKSCCTDGSCKKEKIHKHKKMLSVFSYAFKDFLEDISLWLLMGLAIAAGIAVAIPDSFFQGYFDNSLYSMLIILAVSVPMYVCATGSVPIAAMLMMKGLSPGTALVFLMAGPATNAATITILAKTLGKKTTSIYVASIALGAIFFGVVVDYLLPREWFGSVCHISGHSHEMGAEWWKYLSAVVLLVMMAAALWRKYIPSKSRNVGAEPVSRNVASPMVGFTVPFSVGEIGLINVKTIGIDGMTCNHCKAAVEKTISALAGISTVNVDLASKSAKITGTAIDLVQIEYALSRIGYRMRSS